ncbi:MAG TPA: ubiquinol-cytochrome c reductase iron-sulfur subunit [Acidimicrobiia bacterium]|nr:ubiquinol-cytochrome c reductase iron-sulfur subunit [Acidimicrobiia bacterium]
MESTESNEEKGTDQQSRRDVLRTGWKIGGALLIGAGAYTAYEALRPLTTGATGGKIVVGDVSSFTEGSVTPVPAGRLYVTVVKNTPFALSTKCPHLGCHVPLPNGKRFECPCHGSVFDLAGEYIKGPAPHGMNRYPLAIVGNKLVVDTSKEITGPPRGTNTYESA